MPPTRAVRRTNRMTISVESTGPSERRQIHSLGREPQDTNEKILRKAGALFFHDVIASNLALVAVLVAAALETL